MASSVSVIIPTYKRGGDFLKRAIRSVLEQTYPHLEVVVVDDNPPDSAYRAETVKTMEDFNELGNVVYLQNERNMGGGPARNRGIDRAGGDYVTFLDDDDVYLPEKVDSQVQFMEDGGLELSFTDVRIHDTADREVGYRKHPYITDLAQTGTAGKGLANQELLRLHIMHHLTPTATFMFKREALTRIGGFDDAGAGQEFMLMLKAIEGGLKIGYLPVAHLIQYVHEGERITTGINKIKGETALFNIKKRYLNKLGLRQRQYVKFQHHALMMVLGMRTGKWLFALVHLLKAVVTSPLDCVLRSVYHFRNPGRFRDIPGGR